MRAIYLSTDKYHTKYQASVKCLQFNKRVAGMESLPNFIWSCNSHQIIKKRSNKFHHHLQTLCKFGNLRKMPAYFTRGQYFSCCDHGIIVKQRGEKTNIAGHSTITARLLWLSFSFAFPIKYNQSFEHDCHQGQGPVSSVDWEKSNGNQIVPF